MTQKYRVRLSKSIGASLTALAHGWGVPTTTLMRLAVRDLVQHPERIAELLAAPYIVEQDTSTPEQMQAALAYIASLREQDLAARLGHSLIT
jgi:hypothetical protein